jgi:hypothetical protein
VAYCFRIAATCNGVPRAESKFTSTPLESSNSTISQCPGKGSFRRNTWDSNIFQHVVVSIRLHLKWTPDQVSLLPSWTDQQPLVAPDPIQDLVYEVGRIEKKYFFINMHLNLGSSKIHQFWAYKIKINTINNKKKNGYHFSLDSKPPSTIQIIYMGPCLMERNIWKGMLKCNHWQIQLPWYSNVTMPKAKVVCNPMQCGRPRWCASCLLLLGLCLFLKEKS